MDALRRCTIFGLAAALAAAPAAAQAPPAPSLHDSFAIGDPGGVACRVQARARTPALADMFDRGWSILCRDAAGPIGQVHALRAAPAAADARLAPIRAEQARCDAPAAPAEIAGLGTVTRRDCRLRDADVGYRIYEHHAGGTSWVAEGLSGYDDVLRIALATLVADRIMPGRIEVATLAVNDPVAFARVQAGALDADQALAEGYRRNNSGAYAEAAEFFAALRQRGDAAGERAGEYLINQALQKSNLGQFAEADRLFAEAALLPTADRVQVRLRRNFEALHQINQRNLAGALAILDRPMLPLPDAMRVIGGSIEIGRQVAAEINAGAPVGERLGTDEAATLTPEERATILDAQALQLRGTVLRLQGDTDGARRALETAEEQAIAVRDGRVVSIIRLRTQILAERAATAEAAGDLGRADALFGAAIALLEQRYPETAAVATARARRAAFLVRTGRADEAVPIYRAVIEAIPRIGGSTAGMSNLLAPYFETLVARAAGDPAAAADFFAAAQTLVRPGVADTQAQLARQLSQGTGEAAALFRQATVLQREVERTRIALAEARTAEAPAPERADALAAELDRLAREQAAMQARLSDYPQYRALAADTIDLAELRQTLRPGEIYWKLAVVGSRIYGLVVGETAALPYRLDVSEAELDAMVDGLRATISATENGQVFTYPYDVALARRLFLALAGPAADTIARAPRLAFEPDGAMLRLPIGLLVTDDASVAAHAARRARPGADPFDLRGVAWLARSAAISTTVSARGFRDARRAPPSRAARPYLGFGQNAPAFTRVALPATSADDGCQWPLAEWNRPVSAAELTRARAILGGDSAVVTGAAFTDDGIAARADLADFRIVHFATHGFVTAPRPQCPARPALLTSFGGSDSDGLLTFREIYDLRMDADLVILSACDTAGRADLRTTREAGVTTGGGTALDGLVRAFIGAGARTVIASHWPAPDDYRATERLIAHLFEAPAGTSVAAAMQAARQRLMDDAETSHPFYWAGFAIVGDGTKPLARGR